LSPEVQFASGALDDLDSIWGFIANDSPRAAERVVTKIVSSCQLLARFPLMGRQRPELTNADVRFWPVPRYPNYLVVYRPDASPLLVLAVLHGKLNLKSALQGRDI
jgi:plasmid stabilization system protein ParE